MDRHTDIQASTVASTYHVPEETVRKAFRNIREGGAVLLSVSGKIGAGKDTIAPLLLEHLGRTDAVHEFFARPLKEEINEVISILRVHHGDDLAAERISVLLGIPKAKAERVVSAIGAEVRADESETAYTRTDNMRFALQYWGTEVRRAQDDQYWVKKAMLSTLGILASGKSVFVTDARFVNEIDALRAALAITVRLDVSLEEQARRIRRRDGVEMTKKARSHPSETSLDGYEKFDVRIKTDGLTIDETLNKIIERMPKR